MRSQVAVVLHCVVVSFAALAGLPELPRNGSHLDDSGRGSGQIILTTGKNQFWIDKIAKKLAPLFSVITTWNEKCWTTGYDQGTCFTRKECEAKGGTPHGYCAGGFGVCCVFSYSCDTDTLHNRTYFVNPEFPYATQTFTSCRHTITKLDGVCQLRLDFDAFELDRPNEKGTCWADMFFVAGTEVPLSPLCGDLSGHHIYLPIGFEPQVSYFISLNSGAPFARWKIRTTKIKCCSQFMAPGGCLQYHNAITGRIKSFNFFEGEQSNINNLNYGVCVRREKGFCAIQWSLCSSAPRRRRRNSPDPRGLHIATGYSGIKFAGLKSRRGEYFGGNNELRCRPAIDDDGFSHRTNSTLLDLLSCPPGHLSLGGSWSPYNPYRDTYTQGRVNGSGVISREDILGKKDSHKGDWEIPLKVQPKVHPSKKSPPLILKPVVKVPVYKPVHLPSKSTKYKAKPLKPTKSQIKTRPHLAAKPGKPKNPPRIKVKPKPRPKPYKIVRPKVKPKPGNPHNKTGGNCTEKKVIIPIPIPLPIPIPIPIVPVAVVPFPFGGHHGGDEGWDDEDKVISAVEPFLIRIATDEEKEDGLSSFCMDWEQIPCDVWNHRHPPFFHDEV